MRIDFISRATENDYIGGYRIVGRAGNKIQPYRCALKLYVSLNRVPRLTNWLCSKQMKLIYLLPVIGLYLLRRMSCAEYRRE